MLWDLSELPDDASRAKQYEAEGNKRKNPVSHLFEGLIFKLDVV